MRGEEFIYAGLKVDRVANEATPQAFHDGARGRPAAETLARASRGEATREEAASLEEGVEDGVTPGVRAVCEMVGLPPSEVVDAVKARTILNATARTETEDMLNRVREMGVIEGFLIAAVLFRHPGEVPP